MTHKRYLFAPGPTSVPPEILLELAKPVLHHREPEFLQALAEVRSGLKYLFQTSGEVITLSASGTGAMEAAVANLFSSGDRALVVSSGKFGERWVEICGAYGVDAVTLAVPWGEAVNPSDVAETLARDPSLRGVCVQACETSTGVAHDVRALAEVVKGHPNALLIVDAVSALGVDQGENKAGATGLEVPGDGILGADIVLDLDGGGGVNLLLRVGGDQDVPDL
jgi:aspartate aminotransferase-like enzyme